MTFSTIIFYVFAAILIFAALRVITTRNPVHAVLWLVLCFFTAADVWILLGAEFLGIALVLVYVGAVMVLFLFVVMMLDVNFDSLRTNFRSYVPVAATVGVLVLLEMALVIVGARVGGGAPPPPMPGSNTSALGRLIYVDYVYPFEIAAVVLARRHRRGHCIDAPEAEGIQAPGSRRAGEGPPRGPGAARQPAVGNQRMTARA